MTTIIKIIIATLISLFLASCNFDFHSGTRGNGNVQREERTLNEPFSAIQATEGLNVYLTQGNEEKILVEADENLQDLILTEIIGGVLKIHTKENIGYATSKKVTITFKGISKIISTSGSHVKTTNTLDADHLDITMSSGSAMALDVNTASLQCTSSSGSHLQISGKTNKFNAIASSGSSIEAGNLITESSEVKATSGAGITVNTLRELIAHATSGGNIEYYGNPEKVNSLPAVSGSIRKK